MMKQENAGYWNAKQSCYLCMQTHLGVDTEIQIEGEGALFICSSCCADLARTAGFDITDHTDRIERLTAQLQASETDRNLAEAMVVELQKRAQEIHTKRMERVRAAKVEKAAVPA